MQKINPIEVQKLLSKEAVFLQLDKSGNVYYVPRSELKAFRAMVAAS